MLLPWKDASLSFVANPLDGRVRDRLALLFYGAAIGFPGVLALAIKRKLLTDEGGGYDLVASALGLADGTQLSLMQRVALYRWDAFITLLLIPLAWLYCVRPIARRFRAPLTAIFGALASFLLFVELKCFWEVGTFLPARVLAAGAMGAGRKFVAEYLQHGSAVKLGVLLCSVIAAAAAGWWFDRGARGAKFRFPGWRVSSVTLLAGGVCAALPLVPSTPFDQSAAVLALGELAGLGAEPVLVENPASLAPQELMRQYRQVTNAPVPNGHSSYFGAARGYNVLVYMYETLPLACYQDSATTAAYTAFRSLESHAFVAEHHYASYPYSRRAYFSIFSGWYPPHGMRDFTEEAWDDMSALGAPGMVRSARTAGYQTAAYVPEHPDEWEDDLIRYRVLGFERHVVPDNAGATTTALRDAPITRVAWQRPQDDSARAMLKRDIASASAKGKPWFFSFNPQLSHGPWPSASSAQTEKEICARGAAVFQEVDAGLADLLAELDALGQREHTMVVVLGDHGLRTRAEFPGFRGATLDDITFHVPMLIAVPGVLTSTVRVPWTTSHIDIAPSVLDLLGIDSGRELEQGSPMWDARLEDRRVFIFAQGYLGVDGYLEPGRSVMMNYMLQGVSETSGDHLQFSPRQLLNTPAATARQVASVLRQATGLQQAFLLHLAEQPRAAALVGREAAGDVTLRPERPPHR